MALTHDDIPDSSPWHGRLVDDPTNGHVYIQMTYTWSVADDSEPHTEVAYFNFPLLLDDEVSPRILQRILCEDGSLYECKRTADLFAPWQVVAECEEDSSEVVFTYRPVRIAYFTKL